MIAGDNLRFGLGKVERGAVDLGDAGNQQDDEREQARRREDPPAELELPVEDSHQAQAARPEDDGNCREDLGHLVRDKLSDRPHGPQQRVFVAARPPRQEDAQRADPRHRDQVNHARRQVDRGHVDGERDYGDDQKRRDDHQHRRGQVNQAVGIPRDQVFLGDQLDRVGDRLEQAQRPNPVGPDPVLEPRGHLPLEPDHVGHDAGEDAEESDQEPECPANPHPEVQLDQR